MVILRLNLYKKPSRAFLFALQLTKPFLLTVAFNVGNNKTTLLSACISLA